MSEADVRDRLKAIVERIERLEEEKKALSDDIREVYAEAKGVGFDVKALRAIVRLRKMDADEWREQEAVLDTYLAALGMLPGHTFDEEALKPRRAAGRAARAAACVHVRECISEEILVSPVPAATRGRSTPSRPGRANVTASSTGECRPARSPPFASSVRAGPASRFMPEHHGQRVRPP